MAPERSTAEYRPAGFFVLRSPLLTVDALRGLKGEETTLQSGDSDAAIEAARSAARERLVALAEQPEVREAIEVASPSLVDALATWASLPEGPARRKLDY